MADRPPRDLDWIPDDTTGIEVPTQPVQDAGWQVEIPPRQFFNWLWNRCTRWFHYLSGISQEWIVIDSVNTKEADYATLVAWEADTPAAGDKILIKEDQTLTSQFVIPNGVTLKFLDGASLLCATNIATSILKSGNDIIIEGVLNLVLSQTGVTAVAVELNGDNTIGQINIENAFTGTLTSALTINAAKTGNKIDGFVDNTGGGTLTSIMTDNAAEDSNNVNLIDAVNNQVIRSLGANTMFSGFKFALGSDADGDTYHRASGVLTRLPKAADGDVKTLVSGLPAWVTPRPFSSFSVHKNNFNQNGLSAAIWTKITWTTKEFDTNGDFDIITNDRFTPTVADKYILSASIGITAATEGDLLRVAIYKNGLGHKLTGMEAGSPTPIIALNLTATVDANGTTDYFEVFAYLQGGGNISGNKQETFFTGARVS